jgi:multicomponent Na+:H+ antiporter subunit D
MSPVLLIVLPLLLAFVSTLFSSQKKNLLILASLVNVALVFMIENGEVMIGGFQPPFGISLLIDGYSAFALTVVNLLFFGFVLVNVTKIKKYATVGLILLTGINGMILTNDLFNLFVFIELTAIATYILTTNDESYKSTFQYLVIGVVGSGIYLLGLMSLYNIAGTLNLSDLMLLISINVVSVKSLTIPFLFMFIGLAVEVKMIPVNGWVKTILSRADEMVGPMVGSILAGTYLFVFGRIATELFTLNETITTVIVVLSLVTLITGEAMAFSSKKIREIILYSSIAQAGLITILFMSNLTYLAVLAVLSNVLSKFVMYYTSGKLNDEMDNLKGVFIKNKCVGIPFTISALSIVGFPLFIGFYVKMNSLYSLIIMEEYLIPAIILITAVIEGAYFIRLIVKLWNPSNEGVKSNIEDAVDLNIEVPVLNRVVMAVIVVTIITFGFMPTPLKDFSVEANSLNESSVITEIETLGGNN